MGEKCDSHNDCFERLYSRVESFEAKLDKGIAAITGALHDGSLVHARHDWEIAQLKEKLANRKTNWTQFFVDLLKDAVRFGFFAGGAAAWWAVRNGYGGQ